ncbi:Ethidium bromide-methyl viologen resistance protein EmrE [Roseibacterium elongatum DSM 19469]|uniref:Ethidium bromide-methyl viologen resistance protein EmrE n=1 Tax=Roseicyclus elongatus DSM 19469 TaxID=1294273 RepID=W8RNZ3_9RHOB|nr:multidrug efflux SMR transporter [Roseibacterium elongatum]AHM02728.1 Ethidium bromide-methyl viologen resistance protein EmrE [Roseibacterium elongatum DSM 19469]
MIWLYLVIAIAGEVVATTALKASDGFTRLGPAVVVVAGYSVAFYFLALVLRSLPLGVTYAIWSGLGVALVTLIGWLVYDQRLDGAAVLGIGLIVSGVLVLNLFSGTTPH